MGVLLALLPLALAGRLVLFVERPLWADELFTLWTARLSFRDLIAALRLDSGPPGFYILERPFVAVAEAFGADALARTLPFLAGIALIAAARALPPGTARRIGAALLAAFALLGLYSVEARAYALLALLLLVLYRLAVESHQRPASLAGVVVIGATALYVHYLAIPAIAVLLAVALARRRFATATALTGGVLFFVPWLPILLAQPRDAVAWMRESPAGAALGFLSALGGTGRVPLPFGTPPPAVLRSLSIAVGLLLVLALLRVARRDPQVRDAVAFVGGMLGLCLLLSFAMPFAFAGRTEVAVLPVWIWAIARGAGGDRLVRTAAAAAAGLGLLALGWLAAGPHPDSAADQAARALDRLARPGDVLFAGPGLYLPFRIAADRGRLAPSLRAFPAEVARHPGWWVPAEPAEADYAAVADAAAGKRAIFALLPPGFVTPKLAAILKARGSVRELSLRPEAVLLHWSPEGAGPVPRGAAPPGTTAAPSTTHQGS